MEDVESGLQVVRTLLRLGQFQRAADAFVGDLSNALSFNLEADVEILSIVRPFFLMGWACMPMEVNPMTALVVLPRFNGQVVKPPAYTTIDTMNRQRRRFTTEQKAEAVGLCLRENLSILEASKRLGVHASCLGRWVKQAQIDQGGLKDSGPLTSDERIEFTRLRKENRELRREKDFFRLAAAHFAKEQLSQRGFQ
jgi:transposase-like protein